MREAFAACPLDPAALAFALAALPQGTRPVLWVQDRAARREGGRLYGPSADARGRTFLRVEAGHPRDALWAMEEGASCAGLSAVVGEIHGAPAALDLTATRRLALRAEASGVPVWLIRSGPPGLSAARERWRVGSLPSAADPFDPQAPGAPLWEAELFRARGRAPGRWVAARDGAHDGARDGASGRLDLAPLVGDGPLAAREGPRRGGEAA